MLATRQRLLAMRLAKFEYAIPCADAEEILRTMCDGIVLNKVRHFVMHKDATWQVDVYDDILKGIVIAEIEPTQSDQGLQIPDWVGAEVTMDRGRRSKRSRTTRRAWAQKTSIEIVADFRRTSAIGANVKSKKAFPRRARCCSRRRYRRLLRHHGRHHHRRSRKVRYSVASTCVGARRSS
jgi:hypothetical protein